MTDATAVRYTSGGVRLVVADVDGTLPTPDKVTPSRACADSLLATDGITTRVVSMPCWELFERQPQTYRGAVLTPEQIVETATALLNKVPARG